MIHHPTITQPRGHRTMPEEAMILRAIAALKDELNTTINTRHDSLASRLDELAAHHADNLLLQERRNSTFADRDRAEDIARNVHNLASTITGAQLRISKLEQTFAEQGAKLDHIVEHMNDQSHSLLGEISKALATALVVAGTAVLAFLLASHGIH